MQQAILDNPPDSVVRKFSSIKVINTYISLLISYRQAQDKRVKPEISAGTMAHSIGNSKDIYVGTNKGKIGADNVINISGRTGSQPNTGNSCNTGGESGLNSASTASGNTGNATGEKSVNIGNTSNMTVGDNAGDIGAKNTCNVSRGDGVKISIGNMGNMVVGDNAGGIGVGNNCNVNSESWEGAPSETLIISDYCTRLELVHYRSKMNSLC
ncbi:hypothetical protein EPR50_G00139000 [Perca flavescens]|uniref:Uncharacterized protein n=1 Tax=Perca flavescens TaxID=8167 RepID=A0A484CST4_PERFV|nr:hypothetical protein EPR50_G00139000 [Perca flavescens]